MIKSMTGFGRGHFEGELFACSVEIKSVNHRFLDLHMKLPSELGNSELQIKKWVQAKLKRGRVDLFLNIDKNDAISVTLNAPLLQAYLKGVAQLRDEFAVSGEIDVLQLLRTPGILNLETLKPSADSQESVERGIEQAVLAALQDLDALRTEEGKALREDLLKRLEQIQTEVFEIRRLGEGALEAYQERLRNRLAELLQGVAVDSNRLIQEAAFYVERSDITEELTRLDSHVEQTRNLLDAGEDVGKTLDFLLQEMNRETNTVLSKTTGVAGNGLEIANRAIRIKGEIEKIREQIQNVE